MWVQLQSPLVRCVVVVLAIAGLTESLLCTPMHGSHHRHDAACDARDGDVAAHEHDGFCDAAPAPCDCPDGHDCGHCAGHHQVAVRTPRSFDDAALVAQPAAVVTVCCRELAPAPPAPVLAVERPPQPLRSLRSTILLI